VHPGHQLTVPKYKEEEERFSERKSPLIPHLFANKGTDLGTNFFIPKINQLTVVL
jgi:hypothetical protein